MLEIIQGEQQPYKIDLQSKKSAFPFDLTGNVEVEVCFKAGSTIITKKKSLSQVTVDNALLGQISGNLEINDTNAMTPLTDGQIEVLVNFTGAAVKQIDNIDLVGATDGTYTVSINGIEFSFVAASNTATEIRDGLLAAIASSFALDTIGSGDSLDLTAVTAGAAFVTVLVSNPGTSMVLTTPTPNVSPNVKKAQIINAFKVIAKICP